jgi:nucleotide-binding universal stress UspA family protein
VVVVIVVVAELMVGMMEIIVEVDVLNWDLVVVGTDFADGLGHRN